MTDHKLPLHPADLAAIEEIREAARVAAFEATLKAMQLAPRKATPRR
jgi:hypothetical protein